MNEQMDFKELVKQLANQLRGAWISSTLGQSKLVIRVLNPEGQTLNPIMDYGSAENSQYIKLKITKDDLGLNIVPLRLLLIECLGAENYMHSLRHYYLIVLENSCSVLLDWNISSNPTAEVCY